MGRATPLLFLGVVRTLSASVDAAGGLREIDDVGESISGRGKVAVAVCYGNTGPSTVFLLKKKESFS